MANTNEPIISWEAAEFRHYPKRIGWYVVFAIVAALLVVYQIFHKDYFGAISVAIIAGFFFFFSRQQPGDVIVSLTDKEIRYGDVHYPYTTIRYFWIVDTEQHKTLNIETTAYLNRTIIIELGEQDPEEVRAFLNTKLVEHPTKQETVAQRLMHRIGF